MFPLLVWILRVVSKHFYVNKFWNISIYFGHFQKLHEIDGKTFSHIMGRSKVKKLREINRNYDHDAMIIWRETATISFLTNFDGKTFLIILACYGVKKFESFPKNYVKFASVKSSCFLTPNFSCETQRQQKRSTYIFKQPYKMKVNKLIQDWNSNLSGNTKIFWWFSKEPPMLGRSVFENVTESLNHL